MKLFILRSIIWGMLTVIGSLLILSHFDVTNLTNIHKADLVFGMFIGFMACQLQNVFPQRAA